MKTKSLIFIILAGIFWGTSCIFVNYLAPYGIDSVQMTGVRGFVSLVIMAGFLLIKKRECFKTKPRSLLLFIGGGVSLFATATLYYMTMQMTSVTTAVILLYMSPVIVTVASCIFLGERMNTIKLSSIILMTAGGFLVSGITEGIAFNAVGILLGVLSAFTYAVYNVLTKIQMKNGDEPYTATLYTFLTISAIALFTARPWEIVSIAKENPLPTIPLLIGIGVATFIIPYFLYTASLKELSAGVASTLSIIEPVSAAVFSVILLSQKLSAVSIIGIMLVVVAVAMISIGESPHAPHKTRISEMHNED